MRKMCVILLLLPGMGLKARQLFTLKQCIAYGLLHNRNRTLYVNQQLGAAAARKEVQADYYPRVSLNAALDNNLLLQQSIIPPGVLGPDEVKITFTQRYNSDAVAQIDQVVYDGTINQKLLAAGYVQQQADWKVVQSEESIIYNVYTAWFQLLVYREQLQLLAYNKTRYQQQEAAYRLQVNKGTLLQKELNKVSVALNNTLSAIRIAEGNMQLAMYQLKYEMGYPVKEELAIDFAAALPPVLTRADSTRLFNPSARADYQLAQLQVKQYAAEQAGIRAEALPKLNAWFRYGAVGFGNNLKGAYSELLPYAAVGLKVNIPLLDFYKRNARYRQATISRLNAEENVKLSEDKGMVEYENARTRLLQAAENIENDKRTMALAEEVVTVTDLQFRKGTTDITDWLSTQQALKEAQSNYLNALYSFYRAQADVEKAAGSLKTFYQSL